MHGWDMSGWDWLWMTAMMVIVAVPVILLFLVLVGSWGKGSSAQRIEKPEDILARRFALGEIGKDEYGRALSLLQAGTTATQHNASANSQVT